MKLGVLTAVFGDQPLEQALDSAVELGLEAVEIGCGGYVGKAHCNAQELLADKARQDAFVAAVERRGLIISALSVHGNPLHPDEAIASQHQRDLRDAVQLAERIGVERINLFPGCPGDPSGGKYPNWVTCPWPPEFLELVTWQWNEKLIPFWKEEVGFARKHGAPRLGFEMHPGFPVYNPETLLKLRDAVGDELLGCNFDPSHLFWQGIDPIAAVRKLGKAIHHVHAKDSRVDPYNVAVNGVLDTKHYTDELNRAWIFRSVGYGHGVEFWKDLVSNLRLVGYDFVLSIEHEDSILSGREGLRKAVAALKEAVAVEPPPVVWWA